MGHFHEDFDRGRLGLSGDTNSRGYQEGVASRNMDIAIEAGRRSQQTDLDRAVSRRDHAVGVASRPSAPLTLGKAAYGGAVIVGVLFAVYAFGVPNPVFAQLVGQGAVAVVAGALAGAAFHVAIQILILAVKVAAWITLVAIVLQPSRSGRRCPRVGAIEIPAWHLIRRTCSTVALDNPTCTSRLRHLNQAPETSV